LLPGFSQLGCYLADKPGVAGQAKQIINAIELVPRHQAVLGKPRIGAHQDAQLRPAGAKLADNAPDFFDGSGAGVDFGRAPFGRERMPAARDVKWQIAIAVVKAVEKPFLLTAVQRVVCGVEVENDLPRRTLMGIEEQLDKRRLDRLPIVTDFVPVY
jgi:hypothetical protein